MLKAEYIIADLTVIITQFYSDSTPQLFPSTGREKQLKRKGVLCFLGRSSVLTQDDVHHRINSHQSLKDPHLTPSAFPTASIVLDTIPPPSGIGAGFARTKTSMNQVFEARLPNKALAAMHK